MDTLSAILLVIFIAIILIGITIKFDMFDERINSLEETLKKHKIK
mgnify:CR=1 FL=1